MLTEKVLLCERNDEISILIEPRMHGISVIPGCRSEWMPKCVKKVSKLDDRPAGPTRKKNCQIFMPIPQKSVTVSCPAN
jgi:hypothetical protein